MVGCSAAAASSASQCNEFKKRNFLICTPDVVHWLPMQLPCRRKIKICSKQRKPAPEIKKKKREKVVHACFITTLTRILTALAPKCYQACKRTRDY